MATAPLTDQDYQRAALELNCELPAIKAVAEVESRGEGFLSDGRPVILFEAHKFSFYTGGKYDQSHPQISSSTWNKKLYKGGAGEHDRLNIAIELDRRAALMSASWGRFQIMGFNFALAGFVGVEEFVAAMQESEARHLEAFVQIVRSFDLEDELRRKDWAGFARIYNGQSYRANRYDHKMREAYRRFRGLRQAGA